MILSPPILALLCCSVGICGLMAIATAAGMSSVAGWNHDSNSPRQLRRENRWFLVQASLRLILGLQLLSLVAFVATADHLKTLFTGAMCAVGTLNASPFGVPALVVKSGASVLCGLWLVVDRAAADAASNGLVRFKAAFLVVPVAAIFSGTVLEIRYFADLDPEIITSCCATIFDPNAGGVAGGLAAMPVGLSQVMFCCAMAASVAVGLWTIRGRRSTVVYAVLAAALGLLTTSAVVTWIAPMYYELPTHHCPLCLMAAENGYVGYPLYLFLAMGVVFGVGSGLIRALRPIDVHHCIRNNQELGLCAVSLSSFVAIAVLAAWPVATSPFRMGGY